MYAKKVGVETETEELKSQGLEWKALLLLQFQPQFEIAIMFSIYLAYNCSIIDLAFVYGAEIQTGPFVYEATCLRLIYCYDIMYAIDIVLMMSYRNIQWSEVEHLHDRRSTPIVALDIISTIPWDALYVSLDEINVRTVYILRIRYVLRIFRFIHHTLKLKDSVEIRKLAVELLHYVITYTLILTTLSCIYYTITCQSQTCPYRELNPLLRAFYAVNGLMVFELTVMDTDMGALFYLWLVLINLFSFIYFTSVVISRLTFVKIQKFSRQLKFAYIKRFTLNSITELKSQDAYLVSTYNKYLDLLWKRKRGIVFDNINIKIIPTGMAKDINLDISWDPLKHTHLFRDQPVEFLRLISPYLKQTFLMPGEVIFERNHLKSKMVYIVSGVIQVLSEQDGESSVLSLSGGTCIGESTLLIDYRSTYTVICQSFCEVSILERRDFVKVYLQFPHMYKVFQKIIQNRYMETKKYYNAMVAYCGGTQQERETFTLKWLKSTLYELMLSKNKRMDNFSSMSVSTENNVVFCTKYLDLLAITDKEQLVTDIVFLKDTCPCILQPDSFIIKVWNKIIEANALAFMIIYPYYASFEPNTSVLYFVYSYFIFILWVLDIYVAFSTAVRSKDRFLTKIKEIAIERIEQPTFFMDLVAIIPLGMIAFIIDNHVEHQKVVLLQAVRLVKCYKIENLFYTSKLSMIQQTYTKFMIYLLLLIYYLAALLYLKSCYNNVCIPDNLLRFTRSITNDSAYIVFVYISFVAQEITSTGITTTFEEDYSLFLIQFAMNITPFMFYMYFVSSAIATETLTSYTQLKGLIFIKNISATMKKINIKPELNNLVISHIQNQLATSFRINYKLSYTIIEKKHHPFILQNVRTLKYGGILKSIPLFSKLPKTLVPEIAAVCRTVTLGPNEIVTFSGETCKEICIILKGYCKVASKESKKTIIGECSLLSAVELFMDIPVVRTVITVTHCKLIVIPSIEIIKVLSRYPKVLQAFNTTAKFVSENVFFDRDKETCDYTLEEMDIERVPSFKHFGYYLLRDTKEGIDYHKKFDELESFGFIRYLLLRHTIKSDGLFLKYWELFRCVFAFLTAILTPIIPISQYTYGFWWYILIFLDITAWFDIYIRHHICYFNRMNIEVTHPFKTATNYWKNALVIDVLGVFPLDYILVPFFNIENTDNARVIIKMVKLLQTYRIFRGISYLNKNLISPTWIILRYLPITIILINTFGTLLINLECEFNPSIEASENFTKGVQCVSDVWLNHAVFEKPLSPLRIYLYGYIYATVIIIGPALLNLHMSAKELFWSPIMGLLGYLFFVYVSARIITSSIYRHSDSIIHDQTMRSLNKFLSCRRLDFVLKNEIITHFEYVFEIQQKTNMQKLIKQIGFSLEAEILLDVFGEVMKESMIFSYTSNSFLKNLLVHMKYQVILNMGIICKINDVHNDVYFIVKGQVDVLSADYNHLLFLPKGSLFGCLANVNLRRQKLTMVATGNVELLNITSLDFHKVLKNDNTLKLKFSKLTFFNTDYISDGEPFEALEERDNVTRDRRTSMRIPKIVAIQPLKESTFWEIAIAAYVYYLGCLVELYLITMQDHTISEILFIYSCDILFVVNMYLQFHFQYTDDNGIVITDKKKIAQRYMKNRIGFYFSLASVLPFELISLFFIKYNISVSIWHFCRINRLLKIVLLARYLKKIASQLSTNMIINTITLGVWITLTIESITSIVIGICCLSPQFNLNPPLKCNWTDSSTSEKLVIFIDNYCLITNIFTSSVLSKTPSSVLLIILFIILLVGLRYLAILIIKETVAVLELLTYNKQHYEKITYQLKQYLYWRDTSLAIVNRIRDYLNFLWKYKRGNQFPILLNEAPYYLREGVLNSLYGYLLRRHSKFSLCHVDLIRQMTSKMRPVTFLYGDYIAFKDDVDECMYFVHEGGVDAISEETRYSEKVFTTINRGECFGYEAGLYPLRAHEYTYRANQLTSVVVLKRNDWIYLLDFFPASKNIIYDQE